MLHFCTACTLLVCAKPTRQKESARGACFAFLACCFFFFPCVLLKAPQQNRAKAPQQNRAKAPQQNRAKAPQPSPERAPDQVPKGPQTKSRKGPDQVPKGPQTVRKHPRLRLERGEAMPNSAFCTPRLFELTVPCFLSPAAFATCYAILVSTE
jgi:hypothetical protein